MVGVANKKTAEAVSISMVELRGLEPLTSTVRL